MSDPCNFIVEKRPGADWQITYMDIEDGSYHHGLIFGLNDLSKLEIEIISLLPMEGEYEIVLIQRLGYGLENEKEIERE